MKLTEIRGENDVPLFWTVLIGALKKGQPVNISTMGKLSGAEGFVTKAELRWVAKGGERLKEPDEEVQPGDTIGLLLHFTGRLARDRTTLGREVILPASSDQHLTLKMVDGVLTIVKKKPVQPT